MCKNLVSAAAVVLLFAGCSTVNGFVIPQQQSHQFSLQSSKGFGDAPKKTKKPQKSAPATPSITKYVNGEEVIVTAPTESNPYPAKEETDLSQGQKALERMRRQRAEKRAEELRRVKEVQETDALLREQPGAAVIPERVAQRMGRRMLPFVGIPLLGGMGAFVGFWYMATYRDMEFQPALVAATTIGMLAIGLVGITYSVMSASWDEDREGSFLGTEEFSRNLDNIKEGLTRSKENAILRERIDEFSPEELAYLERKQAADEKRRQSFNEKFGEDLE